MVAPKKDLAKTVATSLKMMNTAYNTAWDMGTNWTNVGNEMFETYINKFLFPKINETTIINVALGNRFDFLAKEVDFVGQFSEEYVILDTVPIALDLSKNEELMLKRNYPKMATKLYNSGIVKKLKFTLNNNDVRFNFSTLGDAINYAIGVYRKKISDINVAEEAEIKGMIIDYALNHVKTTRSATSEQELFSKVFEAVMNLQNNSAKFNEADSASGGKLGRYTTQSKLGDLLILTNDKMKAYLLDTKLANTFQVAGLDLSNRIISFEDLGGVYKVTEDVTIASADTINKLLFMGDYQVEIGDIIPTGAVFTYDITDIPELTGKIEEVKPTSDLFAFIFDVKAVKYRRYTKGMLKPPFYNGEFDEVNYWIHYYSYKAMSPFFNKIVIQGE